MNAGNHTPPEKKIRRFQMRWAEPLGNKACPYAYRWTLNLWLFAIRVHQWIKTEDSRNKHDHPWGFFTMVVKGGYTDVADRTHEMELAQVPWIVRDRLGLFSIRYRPATHRHYVEVNEGGCWTILLTGPVVRNWGYWVNGKLQRPMRYFGKWGHPICSD